jgi:TrmH family RNA methyltransferase
MSQVRVVLVRPAEPMNLGAVARAMKNCDLDDLVLVDPKTDDLVTARRVAVHAEELLAAPRTEASIADAVKDCVWVVGTTSRLQRVRAHLTPREVAQRSGGLEGRIALVFGGEESGLSNDDLVRCHDVSTIPSGTEQPSFNLAQAVLVYGYELFQARLAPSPTRAAPGRASDGDAAKIELLLRDLLAAAGFADLDRPRHGVLDLVQPLRRAGLTTDEARLWQAALRALVPRRPTRAGKGSPALP